MYSIFNLSGTYAGRLFRLMAVFMSFILLDGCSRNNREKPFQAYCIDFNWGPGGVNGFAAPGLWADADPEELIEWYADMGCTAIQTFAVSCNGYAWYKNGLVPEQPGLKCDFLTEMVRLGHRKHMEVYGYFCAGANTRWGMEHPESSYGTPSGPHIPFTREYLDFLAASIEDAVKKTGMDGFMVDWIWNPGMNRGRGRNFRWLDCEKVMYRELMGEEFPGKDALTPEQLGSFRKKAIERCWQTIYKAAKKADPECKVWVTCNNVSSRDLQGSSMFRQADILMNEAGSVREVEKIRPLVGEHTRLVTCLAKWNGQDPGKIVPEALEKGIGLYGFTKPDKGAMLSPVSYYLARPLESYRGDERNIAYLARVFNGRGL